jgi:hypothetical protein
MRSRLKGVTILVAHDFDISGLTIAYTLGHDTRRYKFENEPNVIDIGLRLEDVKGLESEQVWIKQDKDPRDKFTNKWHEYNGDYDVTEDELGFLVEGYSSNGAWRGKRVELNAMTSAQLIAWLERKLEEHGVEKVVPDEDTLAAAWQRARRIAQVNEEIQKIIGDTNKAQFETPADLAELIRLGIKDDPEVSWDEVLNNIAVEESTRRTQWLKR